MADYPLNIGRGNVFDIGFRFRDENGDLIEELLDVWFTVGIGDTVFVQKELTKSEDNIYYLSLTEDETRLIMPNFNYEIEADDMTVLSGPTTTDFGDNIDGN